MKNTHKVKNIFAGIAAVALAIILSTLSLTSCANPANGGGDGGTHVINIAAIQGVTPPAAGGTPVTTITPTAQYTGTVIWSPVHNLFQNSTVYFATITLTPQKGYILEGVPTDFFTVMGANRVNNDADSSVIIAVFPTTAGTVANPAVIDIPVIDGITPVSGEIPKTAITPTPQYTGTITWSPADNPFEASTVYTATITFAPKTGFTYKGVAADFFTVVGAALVNNDANSGVITVVFLSTGGNPTAADYDIGNLTQTAGSVTAVTITPKKDKSPGAITIYYNGSTTLPTAAGTYSVTFDVAAAANWNAASSLSAGILTINMAEALNVTFTGPTEKIITVTKTITNNLSKSGGGSITLSIGETFDKYEWFVGETKVASGNSVTLQANNTVFVLGYNWITVVVYDAGTSANATPWSGEFMVWVSN